MSPTESVLSSKANESVPEAAAGESAGSRWKRILFILLCVEIGMFLLLIPWSPLWARNLLVGYYPSWRPFDMNSYGRGGVSGLGLINLWLGLWQAWNFRHLATRPAGEE